MIEKLTMPTFENQISEEIEGEDGQKKNRDRKHMRWLTVSKLTSILFLLMLAMEYYFDKNSTEF